MTCSECVSAALVLQHAKCMRRIMLSFIACLVSQNLSTLSRKLYDFRENAIEHKMCVDFLYNFCLKHFSF
jgi:hypothetical protein